MFFYIQQIVTRNKLTQFRPGNLETLTFLQSKKICILRTIISSLVNKIIIILLCYTCAVFSLLSLRILYFLCYLEVFLDFKLERIYQKISKDFSKYIVSDGQMQLILKHKCTFIRCSYHFNTPFCVIRQYSQLKRQILWQKENNTQSNSTIFFLFYVGWTYILIGSLFIKVESQ